MIYKSPNICITSLEFKDALKVNKLFVSNTERFFDYLPRTLADNTTLESTKNYIKNKIEAAAQKREFVFVITEKYNIEIIGLVILKNVNWGNYQGEFAYCIDKNYEGKGFMAEAIKAISAFAKTHFSLKTLRIIAHKSNPASVNVALRSGFHWKETLKNEFEFPHGKSLDMELYELDYEK